jgi:hypothetical protein
MSGIAGSHIERIEGRIRVHGPEGSYLFQTDFGPGVIAADPYGGPGGTVFYELELYEDGSTLLLVATRVAVEYGEHRTRICYLSRDGGRDFRPLSEELRPTGTLVQAVVMK